jgi:serine/threonine protein phosphatase PrpC
LGTTSFEHRGISKASEILKSGSELVYRLEPLNFTTITSSDKGPREEQQDAAGAFSRGERLLAVVCDGAGGHRGGSTAAKLAVQIVCETFEKAGGHFEDPKAELLEICRTANEAILKLGETPKLAPRSTISLLYLDGKKAHMVHLGDSRIYRLRSGKFIERTRDHTMVQILLEQGEVKEAEMGTHPDQRRLLRALGSEEELRPTYGNADLTGNDEFLLCSDGFWERTLTEDIEKLFKSAPTQTQMEAFVQRAVKNNGPKGDNVTALAVFPQNAAAPTRWLRRVVLLLALVALVAILLLKYSWPAAVSQDLPVQSERPLPAREGK